MKRGEAIVFGVLLLVVSVLFARATRISYFAQALDEAYFREGIDTTASTGRPQTFLTASVIEALQDLISRPANEVCMVDLTHTRLETMSVSERHAFPIFYPLAAMRIFTDSLTLLVLCAVVAFPCLLGCVYVFARRFGCPPWLSGVLVVLTAAHPAWSYAAFGQFYPDKMFPFFCLIYLVILYEYLSGTNRSPWLLLTFGILAASTSERSAVMLVAATGVGLAWYSMRRGFRRVDLVPLALTVALALYVYGYMHYVQLNPDYGSFSSSMANFLKAGLGQGLSSASRKFLLINAGLLFPFSLVGGLWSAVAAGSLLPNLMGSVAGAEKLGWTAHYHSPYFPFLIFASIAGAAALYRRSRRIALAGGVLAAMQAALLLVLNPFTPDPLFDLAAANVHTTALAQIVEFQTGTGPPAGIIDREKHLRSVAAHIPEGSEVSTTEFFMPALYDRGIRRMRFYPLGVGKVKYVVVQYKMLPSGNVLYRGHVSFHQPSAADEVDACLTDRLNSTYRVAHLIPEFDVYGTAILELK